MSFKEKKKRESIDQQSNALHAKLTSHTFLNYTTNTTDVHKFAFLESFERASLAFLRVRRRAKLWDTRGNVPVHSVKAHEDKCFAVDFFGPDTFCTGGNDGKLKFYTLPKYKMDDEED